MTRRCIKKHFRLQVRISTDSCCKMSLDSLDSCRQATTAASVSSNPTQPNPPGSGYSILGLMLRLSFIFSSPNQSWPLHGKALHFGHRSKGLLCPPCLKYCLITRARQRPGMILLASITLPSSVLNLLCCSPRAEVSPPPGLFFAL